MLFSALSVNRGLLRALRASRVSVAGNRAFVCGSWVSTVGRRDDRCGGAEAARGSLSVLKTFAWHVPHTWSRCMSVSAHSSLGQLIYTGEQATTVKAVKAFSYTTSGITLAMMLFVIPLPSLYALNWALQCVSYGVIGFFTFLTPALLHFLTKRYVIRMYHNPRRDVYTAVTCSVFLTEKMTVFHQGEVQIPDVSKIFTTFCVNNKGLFVNPDRFDLPQDYNHLMGYDKPFDFSSDQVDQS